MLQFIRCLLVVVVFILSRELINCVVKEIEIFEIKYCFLVLSCTRPTSTHCSTSRHIQCDAEIHFQFVLPAYYKCTDKFGMFLLHNLSNNAATTLNKMNQIYYVSLHTAQCKRGLITPN